MLKWVGQKGLKRSKYTSGPLGLTNLPVCGSKDLILKVLTATSFGNAECPKLFKNAHFWSNLDEFWSFGFFAPPKPHKTLESSSCGGPHATFVVTNIQISWNPFHLNLKTTYGGPYGASSCKRVFKAQDSTQGFLTPFVFHSNSLANQGSSRASIEVKFHKEFNFLGFVCYFSARIE